MAKLGYTWYPKDWGNSEAVFQLNLTQRGLYRELIDLAMLNDNKTVINSSVWCRKWDIQHDDLWEIIELLRNLELITIPNYYSSEDNKPLTLFIPSCEPRLKMVRGGSNGGKKSKPTSKGIVKPISKPTPKGDSNQKKEKGKESKLKEKILINCSNLRFLIERKKFTPKEINTECELFLELNYPDGGEFENINKHFYSYMKKREPENIDSKIVPNTYPVN
jgi:hypothetical protein